MIKLRLIALLIIGVFMFSTAAVAFHTSNTKMQGNLGEPVLISTLQEREERFRGSCYYTSEGAICPSLTPSATKIIKTQRVKATQDPLPRNLRKADPVIQRKSVKRGDSAVRVVTSITGKPGSFSRWATRKRNTNRVCYFSASTGAKGNLVCPTFVTDVGKNPQSFRPSIDKRADLVRVGKPELGDRPDRAETSHDYSPYRLS